MQALLWPHASLEELHEEIAALVGQHSVQHCLGTLPCIMLVAEGAAGTLSGFILVGLRSHADGCNPAQPVGFIEGWFVREELRQHGIGKALVKAAEEWARTQGCNEMASDALIDNQHSHLAHLALGFEIVDQCVHFRKAL